MARIYVDLNDLVSTWRNKTNELSYKVGDLALLTTGGDSDLVQAINELDSDLSALTLQVNGITTLDSAEVTSLMGGTFPVDTSDITNLAVTTEKIAADAVGSTKLKNLQTLVIYDSAGTTLKTLYAAGT